MNDPIQAAREDLAALEARLSERRSIHMARVAARNKLAYLTAVAVVVIDDGRDVQCQGVSPEAQAELMSLRFSVNNGGVILVKAYMPESNVEIHLQPGGMSSFAISIYADEEPRPYKVWAFEDEIDAGIWMSKRLADFTSR